MNAQKLKASAFARTILTVTLIGGIFILIFEIAEKVGWISKLGESVGRCTIWCVLLALMANVARRASLERVVWVAGMASGGFLLVWLILGITQDVSQLNDVPLVGHDSVVRDFLDKALITGWTCSVLFLVVALLSSLELRKERLEIEVREKANALRQLREAEKQMLERERLSALGQISSGIAHDLNNSLTPVVVACQLLKRDDTSAPQRDAMLDLAMEGAQYAADVVKQLQFFYRAADIEEHVALDLVKVIDETVKLTRPKWHDESLQECKLISVECNLPDELYVLGNPIELKQLLVNLILNAVEAVSDDGTISISLNANEEWIMLVVSDDGPGMSEETERRCMEPFYSGKQGGSGLGLSICQGVVSRHGGDLRIQTNVGHGTTFRIRLPLLEAGTALHENSSTMVAVESNLSGQRVLYVDDQEAVRISTKALLNAIGVDVDLAANGQAGIQLLSEHNYDAVITDLGMAGTSGDDVVRAAREHDMNLPVLVASGWSEAEVASRFKADVRPDKILQKPLDMKTIQRALASLSDTRRSMRASESATTLGSRMSSRPS